MMDLTTADKVIFVIVAVVVAVYWYFWDDAS